MKRKVLFLASSVLLATFTVGAFADVMSPARTTLQTASMDIDVLTVIPGVSVGGGSGLSTLGIAIFNYPPSQVNFTAGFSFSPSKGFSAVNSAVVTVIYIPATAPTSGTAFTFMFNGQTSTSIPVIPINTGAFPLGVAGVVSTQNIRVGSNMVEVGLTPNFQVHLYEVRLTLEYTLLA